YYSNIFLPLSDFTLNYILASMFSVILAWLFFVFWTGRLNIDFCRSRSLHEFSNSTNRKIKWLVFLWGMLSIVEVAYFRDVPVLSLFGVSSISYLDYGIPSFHGFLNALMLSVAMYVLYEFLRTGKKKYLFYYGLLALMPVISLSRGALTSMLIQGLFVVLVFRGVNARFFLKVVVFLILFAFVFGWLGEHRTAGLGDQVYTVFNVSDNYPSWLPKSFLWVYMYLTSSLNNIENIIHSYPLINFDPYSALYGLLPSFIRDSLTQPVNVELVVAAFNVYSFMPNYLSAFGVYGSLLFYFLATLVPMYVFYKYIKSRSLDYGFILVIFLHSIALSVFSDFFAIQVYLFQMILQFFIFNETKLIKR
ncbi:MAG: oligosaccharide repeat unit polymerase, partial [Campylobacterales bacterium]|nr:oligosaccharide repeat unit polymerase [Campylobacterales bacterium]